MHSLSRPLPCRNELCAWLLPWCSSPRDRSCNLLPPLSSYWLYQALRVLGYLHSWFLECLYYLLIRWSCSFQPGVHGPLGDCRLCLRGSGKVTMNSFRSPKRHSGFLINQKYVKVCVFAYKSKPGSVVITTDAHSFMLFLMPHQMLCWAHATLIVKSSSVCHYTSRRAEDMLLLEAVTFIYQEH